MRVLLVVMLLVLGACGGSSGGAGSMVVRTSGADVSTVARYGTYSFAIAERAPEGYARGALPPQLLEMVRSDAEAELQKRGYMLADDGELVVRISTGTRTVEDEPTGGTALAGAPAKKETEAALVIDILERASSTPVFHGYAHQVIRDANVKPEQIAAAVSKMLAPVPSSTRRPNAM